MLHQKSYTINQCDLWFYRASQSRARPYISGRSRSIPCSTYLPAPRHKSHSRRFRNNRIRILVVSFNLSLWQLHTGVRGVAAFFHSTESKTIFGHSGRPNAMWFSFDFFLLLFLSRQSQTHNYYYDSAPPATVTAVAIIYLKETNVSPRRRQKKLRPLPMAFLNGCFVLPITGAKMMKNKRSKWNVWLWVCVCRIIIVNFYLISSFMWRQHVHYSLAIHSSDER